MITITIRRLSIIIRVSQNDTQNDMKKYNLKINKNGF